MRRSRSLPYACMTGHKRSPGTTTSGWGTILFAKCCNERGNSSYATGGEPVVCQTTAACDGGWALSVDGRKSGQGEAGPTFRTCTYARSPDTRGTILDTMAVGEVSPASLKDVPALHLLLNNLPTLFRGPVPARFPAPVASSSEALNHTAFGILVSVGSTTAELRHPITFSWYGSERTVPIIKPIVPPFSLNNRRGGVSLRWAE